MRWAILLVSFVILFRQEECRLLEALEELFRRLNLMSSHFALSLA